MTLSHFLAKLIGLYLLISAFIFTVRKKEVQGAMKDLILSKPLFFYSSCFDLLFGLAIILGHHVLELNWQGLITLIGYLLTLRGILRLSFVAKTQQFASRMLMKAYWPSVIIWWVIGVFLVYQGF